MTADRTKTTPERASRSDGERSRQAILDTAARLATVEGLEGMSIGRLADRIGMSKSGLYAHFGSKEDLQLATIEHAGQIFEAEVVRPAEALTDPVQRLLALGDAFLAHVEHGVFPGGCFFASAMAEFDTHPGPVKEHITGFVTGWFGLLGQSAAAAQAAGRIRDDEDISQLVFELDAFLTMGNQSYLMANDSRALERARKAYHDRVERALTPGT
jgi:AcrR family transcriptional regulator